MSEVLFYHLESARLENVLPGLLEKTLTNGWTAAVRCGDRNALKRIDDALWLYRDDAFLPHGIATGGEIDARQPILITDQIASTNDPDLLFLVEGAEAEATSLTAFKRCVCIFDGGNEDAVEEARHFWKAVKAEKYDATYWRQNTDGKWEKQA